MQRRVSHLLTALLFTGLSSSRASGNAESAALRDRAATEIYNLDRDQGLATYRQAVMADPQDAAAYRGLASALWLSLTFRRGSMTVDDYLGGVAPARTTAPPPPHEVE